MALADGTNCGFVTAAPVADPEGAGGNIQDTRCYALKVTAPAGATAITEIGWWCDNATEAADFDVGIYSHNVGGNIPDALLASSGDVAKGTDAGWKSGSVAVAVTAGTVYWLAVVVDNTTTTTSGNYGGSGKLDYFSSTATPLQATWPGSDATQDDLYGIYAIYTTATGSSVVQIASTSRRRRG